MIVLLLILILCALLFGAGAVLAGFGWLAVIVAMLTLLYALIVAVATVFIVARDAAPKLPEAASAFFQGYARLLGAPILGPVAYWRSVSERRARGERVGAVSISLTLLWTLIVGVFLSWLALTIPLLIAGAAYQASLS
jgi:hypothetical protein